MKNGMRAFAVLLVMVGTFHLFVGGFSRQPFLLLSIALKDSLPSVYVSAAIAIICLKYIFPLGMIIGSCALFSLKKWGVLMLMVNSILGIVATLSLGIMAVENTGSWIQSFEIRTELAVVYISWSIISYLFSIWCFVAICVLIINGLRNTKIKPNHGLESTSAPPAAGTLETHP